jgi:hypothetical protein
MGEDGDHHGGGRPGPPILTTGWQAQADLHFLLPLSGQPALGALPSPREPDYRPLPGATANAVQK